MARREWKCISIEHLGVGFSLAQERLVEAPKTHANIKVLKYYRAILTKLGCQI